MRVTSILGAALLGLSMPTTAAAQKCGDKLQTDTTLRRDLDCRGIPNLTYALMVKNGITLDLNGFTVRAGGGAVSVIGILVQDAPGAVVVNGTLEVIGAADTTVLIRRSSRAQLRSTIINGSYIGVNIHSSAEVQVAENAFHGNYVAVALGGLGLGTSSGNCDGAIVDSNTMHGSPGPTSTFVAFAGFERCDRVSVTRNVVVDASEAVFALSKADDLLISDNDFTSQTTTYGPGVLLQEVHRATVIENRIEGFTSGIVVWGSGVGHRFIWNRIIAPAQIGIQMNAHPAPYPGTSFATISGNRIAKTPVGIRFDANTQYNDARGNVFNAVGVPVEDHGTGNLH